MPPKKKVLVIDDDKTIHAVLKAVLEQGGYAVFSALDGMQGPMMVRNVNPDAILLDMMLPAGGGLSVFERIRQMVAFMQTPILVYSAMPLPEILAKIPEDDYTAVLCKPATPAQILEALGRLLETA